MTKVGVVGAGVMGTGMSQDLAQHGHDVVLVDISAAALERAEKEIRRWDRMSRLYGRKVPGGADLVSRVTFSTSLTALGGVDFLVENIIENEAAKLELYPRLDAVCPADTVFAANTSCVPITRIASKTRRPEQILGMHFMNPVPMKDTVEVIKGFHTSRATLDRAHELLASCGKRGIEVNDSPGFVSNRVLMLTVNEAAFLVHDGVADAASVDDLFRSCFGHQMGPLETADLIGLDTILYSVQVLYDNYSDSKYRPCPLLQKMVDAGLHGRKTGQGFFSYQVASA